MKKCVYYIVLMLLSIARSVNPAVSGTVKINPDPVIYITNPQNGQIVRPNDLCQVSFQTQWVSKVNIQYSIDEGSTWVDIRKDFPVDSLRFALYSVDWLTPDIISSDCQIRISAGDWTASSRFVLTNKEIVGEFPLKIGNKWFYKSYSCRYPMFITSISKIYIAAEIKSLVLKEDNNYYYQLDFFVSRDMTSDTASYRQYNSRFIRQEQNKVFEYIQGANTKLLCDFTSPSSNQILFNKNVRQFFDPPNYDGSYNSRISDSLGFTILYYTVASRYGTTYTFLAGCILDGVIYGEVLNNYVVAIDENNRVPNSINLYQNYPNPFNPATTIKFSIPAAQFVSLKIYDSLGREVETLINEEKGAGIYQVQFNGKNLASGIYMYRLVTGTKSITKKLTFLK